MVAGGSEGKLSGSVRSYNHLVKRSNQVRGSQTMYHNSTSRAQHSAALHHLQFEVLLRANQAIAVQNDLRSGIRTIIQSATEAVACQRCTLFLVSRARQQLTVATSAGFNEGAHAKLADVKLAIDSKSLVGHCAKVAKGRLGLSNTPSCQPLTHVCMSSPNQTGHSVVVGDAYADSRFYPGVDQATKYSHLLAQDPRCSASHALTPPPAFAQSRWRVCL